MMKYLRKIQAFKNLSKASLIEINYALQFENFEKNHVIIKE